MIYNKNFQKLEKWCWTASDWCSSANPKNRFASAAVINLCRESLKAENMSILSAPSSIVHSTMVQLSTFAFIVWTTINAKGLTKRDRNYFIIRSFTRLSLQTNFHRLKILSFGCLKPKYDTVIKVFLILVQY